MKADLVIDASGRGSQTPNWLSALGYPQVEEEAVHIGLGYASRMFKRTKMHTNGGKLIIVYPIVPVTKGAGYLFPVENDQWIITLAGWLKHHPPADEAGFLRYAQELLQPDIYEETMYVGPARSVFRANSA